MVKKLKIAIGKYLLHKELRKITRNIKTCSLDEAKTISLVYDATNRQDYELVKKFFLYFKEKGKKVLAIGFINSKDPNQVLKTQLELRFFTKKDLNWRFKPNCLEVKNFLDTEFDILMDLCVDYCFPVKYVCALSKAKFKVGPAGNDSVLYYDMIIDIGDRKTLEYYLENMKRYVNMVNKKDNA